MANGLGLLPLFECVRYRRCMAFRVDLAPDLDDHAMCINSEDPLLPELRSRVGARLVVFERCDPTSELLAKRIFEEIARALLHAPALPATEGRGEYQIGRNVRLERVRVSETSTSWAEYTEE